MTAGSAEPCAALVDVRATAATGTGEVPAAARAKNGVALGSRPARRAFGMLAAIRHDDCLDVVLDNRRTVQRYRVSVAHRRQCLLRVLLLELHVVGVGELARGAVEF